MNKKELKQLLKDSEVKGLKLFDNEVYGIPSSTVFGLIDQLDEQPPICLEDIMKRINELDFETRGVWLSGIIDESVIGYGSVKYHDGYEHGRIESMIEREKVKIPQFVAEKLIHCQNNGYDFFGSIDYCSCTREIDKWLNKGKNQSIFARAWLDGYEVEKEKEKQYRVKMLGVNEECECLVFGELSNTWKLRSLGSFGELRKHHTRKELEEAGFGWVFDCEGIEVEEVQDD